jgi:hypothetical protein
MDCTLPRESARRDLNLVDLLDGFTRLYVPAIRTLMLEFPSTAGVRTAVGRREPVAFAQDSCGRGYGDAAFEACARELFAELVDETFDLLGRCNATSARSEPVGLAAVRGREGAWMTVTAADGSSGYFCRRETKSEDEAMEVWVSTPASFHVIAGIDDAVENAKLVAAAGNGFPGWLEHAIDAKGVFNFTSAMAPELGRWAELFPTNGFVFIDPLAVHLSTFSVTSTQNPLIVFVDEAKCEAYRSAHATDIVMPFGRRCVSGGTPTP